MLDELDKAIIACLQEDGRMPHTVIAARTGVAEATVRRRLERLVKEGIIKIAAVVDPFKVGVQTVALIHLDVDLLHLEEAAQKLIAMPNVRVVAYTTGFYDMLVEALFTSQQELLSFLKDQLPRIPGVRNSETSIMLQLLKRSYEWALPSDTEPMKEVSTGTVNPGKENLERR
ncbi:MAG: Lrp/AsnC family transcriptional regulator [Candidatus Methanosuratincola sp.]